MTLFPTQPNIPSPTTAARPVAVPAPGVSAPLGADDAKRARILADAIRARFAQTLVGQDNLRESLIVTLVAGGHILIESVPGLAKTTAAQTLATCVSGSFKRVQCTPDLMPSDLVGTQVFDFASQKFTTQIALPKPFMVIATENPIEEEGTFNLPEAQMDRFMMKAVMTYPSPDEEARMLAMLTRRGSDMIGPDTITGERISVSDVDFLRKAARRVHVSDAIMRYAVDITATSRGAGSRPIKGLSSLVRLGASPRATIALTRIGQAKALLSGRDYVVPEDLKAFAHEVLRHRIMLTFEALADGVVSDQIVDKIVETVPVP